MPAELALPADLLSLRAIGPWLRSATAECFGALDASAAESFAARCELALQEVTVNIVTHGYPDGADGATILLAADCDDDALRVVVTDGGTPYDPAAQAEPDPDFPQIHGYGLMIVRQLTRLFDHTRVGDTNRTTLEFALPDAEPTTPGVPT